MSDAFDLERFVRAQDAVWPEVCAELRSGRKVSHWMWFVFPQLEGLGHSAMARRYAIRSMAEARRYLAHATLGARLREATGLVNAVAGRSAKQIFGSPDDMKFHSCLTLFARAQPGEAVFGTALAKYFGAQPDRLTLGTLGDASN